MHLEGFSQCYRNIKEAYEGSALNPNKSDDDDKHLRTYTIATSTSTRRRRDSQKEEVEDEDEDEFSDLTPPPLTTTGTTATNAITATKKKKEIVAPLNIPKIESTYEPSFGELLLSFHQMNSTEMLHFIKQLALPSYLCAIINYLESIHDEIDFNCCCTPNTIASGSTTNTYTTRNRMKQQQEISISAIIPNTANFEYLLDEYNDPRFHKLSHVINKKLLYIISYKYPPEFNKLYDEESNIIKESNSSFFHFPEDHNDMDAIATIKNKAFSYFSTPKTDLYKRSPYFHFKRWSQSGGKLFGILIELLRTFIRDDFIECTSYWVTVLQSGDLGFKHEEIAERAKIEKWTQEDIINAQKKDSNRIQLVQLTFLQLNACQLVTDWISRVSDDYKKYCTSKKFRFAIHTIVNFGVGLLNTGHKALQDTIMQLAIDAEYSESTDILTQKSAKHFFDSLRYILKYQKSRQQISNTNTNINTSISTGSNHHQSSSNTLQFDMISMDETFSNEVCNFLRFLQLLCEGDNRENKKILRSQNNPHSVNIVTEVGSLVHILGIAIVDDIQYIDNKDFNQKFAPRVHGTRRKVISWYKRDEKGHIIYPFQPLHVDQIAYFGNMMKAGLDTLTEMSAGPFYKNQLDAARSGACHSMNSLFDFFGALQTISKVVNGTDEFDNSISHSLTASSDPDQQLFNQMWNTTVGYQITYDGHICPPRGGSYYWMGNDPAVSELLYSREQKLFSSFDSHSNEPFINKMFGQTFPFSVKISPRIHSKDIMKDENDLRFTTNSSTNSNNNPEENIYMKIHEMERVMVDLEQSCLSFLLTLLDGREMEDNIEDTKTILNEIEDNTIIANIINYWERFLHTNSNLFSTTSTSSGSTTTTNVSMDNNYERQLAFQYYSLVMRVIEFPFGANMKNIISKWIEQDRIPIEDHIARIEVHGPESGSLVVVYFLIPEIIKRFWNKSEIDKQKTHITYPNSDAFRSSADEKVRSFMSDCDVLITIMQHHNQLFEICIRNWIVDQITLKKFGSNEILSSSTIYNIYNITSQTNYTVKTELWEFPSDGPLFDYGWTQVPLWDDEGEGYIHDISGSIFNFLYRFIVYLIAPSVVSGIIIDTFASERQRKESIELDVKNRCFICNIDKEDFEQ
eukprot:gene4945-9882_t